MISETQEPISYPSRGLLRFADNIAIPFVALLSVSAAFFVLLFQSHGRAMGFLITWLILAICFTVSLTFAFRYAPDSGLAHAITSLPRGTMGWIAGGLAGLLVLAIPYFDLDPYTTLYLWPLFFPGLILLSRDLSFRQNAQGQFSRLTTLIALYSLLSAATLALPSRKLFASTIFGLANGELSSRVASLEELFVLLMPLLALGTIHLTTYYLMRRSDLSQIHGSLLIEVNLLLARMEDPFEAADAVADLACKWLDFERVIILAPDEIYFSQMITRPPSSPEPIPPDCYWEIRGRAGRGVEKSQGVTFSMLTGVSHESLVTRTSQLVNNAKNYSGFVSAGMDDTLSEINVPVFDLDRPDILIAIIAVQSTRANAFSRSDVQVVEKLRDSIAIYSRTYGTPWGTRRVRSELDKVAGGSTYNDMIRQMLLSAQRLFKTPLVAFIPVGWGTGLPMPGQIEALPGCFKDLSFFAATDHQDPDNPILAMARAWTLRVFDFQDVDAFSLEALPFWQTWLKKEQIDAILLAPVGTTKQRVGLLVVAFQQLDIDFARWLKFYVASFAQGVGPHLYTRKYLETIFAGFMNPKIVLHRYLNEQNLNKGELQRQLGKMSRHLFANDPDARNVVGRIERFLDRVDASEAIQMPNFQVETLESALDRFWADLTDQGRFHAKHTTRIDPTVDHESAELRNMLFRFTTEATLNALTHGAADSISVRIARLRDHLVLMISDNGKGFDPASLKPPAPGSNGILGLAERMATICGASPIDWRWTGLGCGTSLRLTIPLLRHPDARTEILVHDWIDSMEKLS